LDFIPSTTPQKRVEGADKRLNGIEISAIDEDEWRFTLRPLYPRERSPRHPLDTTRMGPRGVAEVEANVKVPDLV
jgi:hypothetical protein